MTVTTGFTVTAAYDRLAEAAAGTVKALIVDDSLTYDDSLEFVADVASAEISGATRVTLTGVSYDAATGQLSGTIPTFTAVTGDVAAVVVYVNAGSDAARWIVSVLTSDPPVTCAAADFDAYAEDDVIASYGESTPDTVQVVQSATGAAGYGALGYYRDRDRLWLAGSLTAGTDATTGHTLDALYRPPTDVVLPVACTDGAGGYGTAYATITAATGAIRWDRPAGFDTLIVEGASCRL